MDFTGVLGKGSHGIIPPQPCTRAFAAASMPSTVSLLAGVGIPILSRTSRRSEHE